MWISAAKCSVLLTAACSLLAASVGQAEATNLQDRSGAESPLPIAWSTQLQSRLSLQPNGTHGRQSIADLQCYNDLAWYAFYLIRLAEEVSVAEVVITIGGQMVVNSTVEEIIASGVGGGGGNLALEVTVTVSYEDQTILTVSAQQLMGLLDGSVSIQEILSQANLDEPIVGEEIFNIAISVNFGDAPVGGLLLGDLLGDGGNPMEVLEFISGLFIQQEISVIDGNLAINNYTVAELIEIFGFSNVSGPAIDFGNLFPLLELNNVNITMPPGWVVEMIDSSGFKSLPSNTLRGNTMTVGNFPQCLKVHAQEAEGTTVDFGGLLVDILPTEFGGQYCMGGFSLSTANTRLPIPPIVFPIPGLTTYAGVCLPDSCTQDNLNALLQDPTIMGTLESFGVGLKGVGNCSTNPKTDISAVEIATIILLVIFGLALVAGTIVDFARSRREKELISPKKKSDNIPMKCLLAFSVIRNTKLILDTGSKNKNAGVIACLFGMRFISMTWVLLGHTYSNAADTFLETDPQSYFEVFRKWSYQPLTNGFPSVDTFFFMGGLLVTYTILKNLDRHGFSWGFIPKLFAHRYLRLTPLYAMVMLITYAFFMRIGSGPFWELAYAKYVQGCKDKWWHNMLYISTILENSQTCVPHGWYLTNDMLYFLATPFLAVPLYLAGSWALIFTFGVFLASVGVTAAVHLAYDAPGSPAWSILGSGKLNPFLDHVYFKPHTRFGSYTVGIFVGYVLYKTRGKKVRLPGMAVFFGWIAAIVVGLAVVYGLYEPNDPIQEDTLLAYGVLHRQAWAFACAWVVFACVNGYAGFINTFLSWPGFRPLGRLAYASYLVHFYVAGWEVFAVKTQRRLDAGMQIYNFIGNLVITHMFAFCAAVAIEFPLGTISNILLQDVPAALFGSGKRKKIDYYEWKRNGQPNSTEGEKPTENGGHEMKKF